MNLKKHCWLQGRGLKSGLVVYTCLLLSFSRKVCLIDGLTGFLLLREASPLWKHCWLQGRGLKSSLVVYTCLLRSFSRKVSDWLAHILFFAVKAIHREASPLWKHCWLQSRGLKSSLVVYTCLLLSFSLKVCLIHWLIDWLTTFIEKLPTCENIVEYRTEDWTPVWLFILVYFSPSHVKCVYLID